jgi:hypothetical protein
LKYKICKCHCAQQEDQIDNEKRRKGKGKEDRKRKENNKNTLNLSPIPSNASFFVKNHWVFVAGTKEKEEEKAKVRGDKCSQSSS